MPAYGSQFLGTFAVPGFTAANDTAFVRLVPPYRGNDGAAAIHKVDGSGRQIQPAPRAISHLSSLIYAAAATVHNVVVMRPLNWTYLTAALASAGTAITLANDPGLYSTKFRYGAPLGHLPASTADNAISAGDYVAFQLRDGTWHFSTIASGSGTAVVLTTAVPTVTGGGADAGTVLYFFGVAADVNPQTNLAHHYFTSTASTRVDFLGSNGGALPALNRGDPMLIYSANATAAGFLVGAAGFYLDH